MAGRGKNMTLPSWMTNQADKFTAPGADHAYHASNGPPSGGYGYGEPRNAGRHEQTYHSSGDGMGSRYADPAPGDRMQPPPNSGYSSREPPTRPGAPSENGRDSRERRPRSRSSRRDRERARDRSGSRRRGKHGDSRSRTKSRSRSRSPSASSYKWKKKPKRTSNFDVKPDGASDDLARFFPPGVGASSVFASAATGVPGSMPHMSMGMQQTRHARRLYVGGIGNDATEPEIAAFFNDIISRALGTPGEMPVMTVYINHDRCFAFVELKTIELTTACMQLDGINYKGQTLRVRRPNDYNKDLIPHEGEPPYLDLSFLGVISTTVPDGPNKVFVGGLPYNLTEDQVKELLSTFGKLKAFHLVRETGALLSKGYGFCEYVDPAVTAVACQNLNGLAIADKTLTVRVATNSQDMKGGMGAYDSTLMGTTSALSGAGYASVFEAKPPTRVLILYNMVSREELENDAEYADIQDDVRQECQQYGNVLSIVIPREKDGHHGAAIGRIFIEYADASSARNAGIALSGKKFGDQLVQADYYSEEVFAARRYGE